MATYYYRNATDGRTVELETPDGYGTPLSITVNGASFERIPEPLNDKTVKTRCAKIRWSDGERDQEAVGAEVCTLLADLVHLFDAEPTKAMGAERVRDLLGVVAEELEELIEEWRSK